MTPGASRAAVGGRYGDTDPPVLAVRVTARAVDGKANEAVVAEIADAFQLPRSQVRIVSGARSRTKVLELDDPDPSVLNALLANEKR